MSELLDRAAAALATAEFTPHFGRPEAVIPQDAEWDKVRATGTALWLDTGDIDEITKLFTAEFSALTTNNTLLNAEIQKGIYDTFVTHAAETLSPDFVGCEIS